ncbi:MAG: hypothetical protein OEX21_04780 [Betaproteobacteria bacterium]|nr:hypothetical protein [Betaproteobacteria bacterium]
MRAHFLVAASLLCLPLAAMAQAPAKAMPAMPSSHPPIGGSAQPSAPSPWAEMADYTITTKVPPKGDTGTWKIRAFADPADVVVDLDTPGAKGRTKGSLMLVGGQAIATKGFTSEKGFEVDPLDVAILNLKVLTRLLDAAAPGGPASVKGKVAVDAGDEKAPIYAATPTASATFRAPWKLKGTVERVDAGTIAFRLEIDVPSGDKPGERVKWSYSGQAAGDPRGRVLEGSTSLAGWSVYSLAPPKNDKPKSHTSIRFGTTKLPGPFATVKDLRAALAKNP